MKIIYDTQEAYDLGYHNPEKLPREFDFGGLIFINAFASGQSDAQNHNPRNPEYDRADYDQETFQRLPPRVTLKST